MPRRLQPIAVQTRDLRPGDRIILTLDAKPMRERVTRVGRERPYPRWGRNVRVVSVTFEDKDGYTASSTMKANSWRVVVREPGVAK